MRVVKISIYLRSVQQCNSFSAHSLHRRSQGFSARLVMNCDGVASAKRENGAQQPPCAEPLDLSLFDTFGSLTRSNKLLLYCWVVWLTLSLWCPLTGWL